jgi:hypothetical protein
MYCSSHPLVPHILREHRLYIPHQPARTERRVRTYRKLLRPAAPFRTSTLSPQPDRKTSCHALRGVVYGAYKTPTHIHAARACVRTSRVMRDAGPTRVRVAWQRTVR